MTLSYSNKNKMFWGEEEVQTISIQPIKIPESRTEIKGTAV